MNKNSVIGLILIAAIMFGFTWYQSKQFEKQRAAQAQRDSISRVEMMTQMALDSLAAVNGDTVSVAAGGAVNGAEDGESVVSAPNAGVYKDEALGAAAASSGTLVPLSNDKLEMLFTTKGAQPYSVHVRDYKVYGGDSLYLVKPGQSDYGIHIYAGEYINTRDFNFQLAERTDSSIVMRLPFTGGGYI